LNARYNREQLYDEVWKYLPQLQASRRNPVHRPLQVRGELRVRCIGEEPEGFQNLLLFRPEMSCCQFIGMETSISDHLAEEFFDQCEAGGRIVGKKRFFVERSDVEPKDVAKYESGSMKVFDEEKLKEEMERQPKPSSFLGITALRQAHRGGRCRPAP
jgi:hypothetical protein